MNRTLLLAIGALALIASAAQAAEDPAPSPTPRPSVSPISVPTKSSYKAEEATIPKRPTAPPSLGRKAPERTFPCQRNFLYRGKTYNCDSFLEWDGENLRPIIRGVPTAVDELNQYQYNRQKVKSMAYWSTAGIAVAGFAHFILYKTMNSSIHTRNLIAIPAVALSAGSLIYGLTLLSTNESHLSKAIDHYNQAHPEDQIELQFSTAISF